MRTRPVSSCKSMSQIYVLLSFWRHASVPTGTPQIVGVLLIINTECCLDVYQRTFLQLTDIRIDWRMDWWSDRRKHFIYTFSGLARNLEGGGVRKCTWRFLIFSLSRLFLSLSVLSSRRQRDGWGGGLGLGAYDATVFLLSFFVFEIHQFTNGGSPFEKGFSIPNEGFDNTFP